MAARILVIEDNPTNLELMRYLLEAFKYRVLTACDGVEGISVAERELPDLILCDIQMPGIDGYEVVRRLRSKPAVSRIPVIAVTALAMVGDRDKALATFDGYLSKPIDPTNFMEKVEAYLAPALRNTAPALTATNTGSAATSPATGRTILAVDNLQANLDLASSIFESAGYTVITTPDAKQALALAQQRVPDLILSDVCMPEGSGYDFIKEVKADPRLHHVPFVFLTSTAMSERERAQGLALGAAKYLFRPIEPYVLLKEVEGCLRGR